MTNKREKACKRRRQQMNNTAFLKEAAATACIAKMRLQMLLRGAERIHHCFEISLVHEKYRTTTCSKTQACKEVSDLAWTLHKQQQAATELFWSLFEILRFLRPVRLVRMPRNCLQARRSLSCTCVDSSPTRKTLKEDRMSLFEDNSKTPQSLLRPHPRQLAIIVLSATQESDYFHLGALPFDSALRNKQRKLDFISSKWLQHDVRCFAQ